MFALPIPGRLENDADSELSNRIRSQSEITPELLNKCSVAGIFLTWDHVILNDNTVIQRILVENNKYTLDMLYYLILIHSPSPNIDLTIVMQPFKDLVLTETNLSIINYNYCHYYMTVGNKIHPAIRDSLKIVARGFKNTELEKIEHILSMVMKYLDAPSYAKLFKAVTEKDQSLIGYGTKLLNQTYEFLFNGSSSIAVSDFTQ